MVENARRAKTARGRRILAKREPKLVENPRTALVVRGQKTSAIVNSCLTDLFMLKKPHAVHFKRHNAVHPFEDAVPLELLCGKNDASLFAFGTHSKKRPHNLVLGRLFDQQLLDMVELGIDTWRPMIEFRDAQGGASAESKPALLFHGEWEHDASLGMLKPLLLDFFQGPQVDGISPIGIDRVMAFTAIPPASDSAAGGGVGQPRLLIRQYVSKLKKSAEGTGPYVDLVECGPSLDMRVRRVRHAPPDAMKAAMVAPVATSAKPKKSKNVEHSVTRGREGRLHVPKQDLTQMATARMKGLRKERPAEKGSMGKGSSGDGPSQKRAKKK